jgi:hypothetical protein
MINKNIKRFCEVIFEINALNKKLDKEHANFYDGGYSFEECNSTDIEDLVNLQNELKFLLKNKYMNTDKETNFLNKQLHTSMRSVFEIKKRLLMAIVDYIDGEVILHD